MLKKILGIVFILCILSICICYAGGLPHVKMIIDSKSYTGSNSATLINGMIFVPAKITADKLKIKSYVSKENGKSRIKFISKKNTVICFVGQKQINLNGSKSFIPLAPVMIDSRIYVPVNLFENYFGISSSYNPKKNFVKLFSNIKPEKKKKSDDDPAGMINTLLQGGSSTDKDKDKDDDDDINIDNIE